MQESQTEPLGQAVTALILAGGQGSRMGGLDKGLQRFQDRPLVQHALIRIEASVKNVIINANRNLDLYQEFGQTVLKDQTPNYPGPLAGIHAGLCAVQTPYLLTLPCDVPYFPLNLLRRLAEPFRQNTNLILTVASSPSGPQPVFSLMRTEARQSLTEFLAQGRRKMHEWHSTLPHAVVEFEEEFAFHNLNTLDELHALEQNQVLK